MPPPAAGEKAVREISQESPVTDARAPSLDWPRAAEILGAAPTRIDPFLWQPPSAEELQRALPQYEIKALIARGGMGAVYRGVQKALERDVAIKILPAELGDDLEFISRFQREARVLARLMHPGIVAIFDFGQTLACHPYFVMEYVGTDLSRVIKKNVMTPTRALELILQICDALHYAHCQGVIHRDIKPANILITADGRAKLADFGIARPQYEKQSAFTISGMVIGTLAYMAPEQNGGHADHRADIYALGVVLYEMLTSRRPEGAFDLPSVRSHVDARLDGVVIRALQQEPERRYQHVSEMKTDLDRIRASPPDRVRSPAPQNHATVVAPNRRWGDRSIPSCEGEEAPTPDPVSTPELAHVLFADVVGYTQFATDEQPQLLQQLRAAVHHSAEFIRARSSGSLICTPTSDGMVLVFLDSDAGAPLRAAREISAALSAGVSFGLRIGLHSGPVYRLPDINGKETATGAGVNIAQRVMDCGDPGHILLSQVHAAYLLDFEAFRTNLHDLGESEVKHGARLHLFNFCDGISGNPQQPSRLGKPGGTADASSIGARVALIYKRHAEPDATLLRALEEALRERGCDVFIDRHLRVGLDWAREIERALREADAVVPLLSPSAAASELLAYELEIADDAAQKQGGRPRLLPVRVNWEGPLPDSVAAILNPIQYTLWRGPADTAAVVAELAAALTEAGRRTVNSSRVLEPPGGAMPLDSQYYVTRPTDAEFHAAISRRDSIVLVEGARQMGKTSLLSRGLQEARKGGAKVTCTDFQKLNASDLASLESFYLTLGGALATQLDLTTFPEDTWRAKSGPNQNFESYIRRVVLGSQRVPFIWALDEVDRLFTCPFGSEVFGLFRSWHNARALDPDSPWHRLTMIICYATEAHLFITDLNQSPFNVGTRVLLRDFGPAEMRQINQLHGEPLATADEFERFTRLLGGQPYLVRRALHEMVANGTTLAELERGADSEQGPFAGHLKRFLVLLSGNEAALQYLREALAGRKSDDAKLFHRLRAAGLLRGDTPGNAAFRCELYAQYLKRHLA